jgi:hypothetical protein
VGAGEKKEEKMTVIAWDGKIIAADKQGTYGNLIRTCTKIFDLGEEIICFCGAAGTSLMMLDWYKNGQIKEDWPESTQDGEDWAQIIVADCYGVRWFDRKPYSQKLQEPFMAWCVGADFAIGAMAMGANAVMAVEIASKFCEGCGRGVDWFAVGEKK